MTKVFEKGSIQIEGPVKPVCPKEPRGNWVPSLRPRGLEPVYVVDPLGLACPVELDGERRKQQGTHREKGGEEPIAGINIAQQFAQIGHHDRGLFPCC